MSPEGEPHHWERTYYPERFRLDGVERWLIWYDGGEETDGVWTDAEGMVPTFDSRSSLRRYAAAHHLTVQSGAESVVNDIDKVSKWVRHPQAETVDCVSFLNAWNLFWDVAKSVGADFPVGEDDKRSRVYDKLFWGNNLPAVTPHGRIYEPVWLKSELTLMRRVLRFGLDLFRSRIKRA